MERSPDRARCHTARSVLRRIDDDTLDHLLEVETKPETTSRRLEALDREWDIDRTVEAEAATMGLIGLALGTFVRPPSWRCRPRSGPPSSCSGRAASIRCCRSSAGWVSAPRARSNASGMR